MALNWNVAFLAVTLSVILHQATPQVIVRSRVKATKSVDHSATITQNLVPRDDGLRDWKRNKTPGEKSPEVLQDSRTDYHGPKDWELNRTSGEKLPEVLHDNRTDFHGLRDWEMHRILGERPEEFPQDNITDYHNFPGKPTKLDQDISKLEHTDDDALHESESHRIKDASAKGKCGNDDGQDFSTNLVKVVVDTRNVNSSEKMDSSAQKNEPFKVLPEVRNDTGSGVQCGGSFSIQCIERNMEHLIEEMLDTDVYNVTDFMQIVRNRNATEEESSRENSLLSKVKRLAKEHTLKMKLPRDLVSAGESRFFGAFGLKKLMLPLFIGLQIIKSVVIALLLPSIIGSIGKILGKGVSSFAQNSQGADPQHEENFDFKDNMDFYNDDYMHNQPIGTLPASVLSENNMLAGMTAGQKASLMTHYTPGNQRVSSMNTGSDNYYSRNSMQGATSTQDYKVFHDIPTSSLLLTNYDPFYSPLLSRLDAVFGRLGYSTEGCREYVVCAMYRSPARFAPYSNLVSAQLSRELNELRKPSSDNPDVLRFFKYMKAAKDGQDGLKCEDTYTDCTSERTSGTAEGEPNQAMLATYQDINKLVQARKL